MIHSRKLMIYLIFTIIIFAIVSIAITMWVLSLCCKSSLLRRAISTPLIILGLVGSVSAIAISLPKDSKKPASAITPVTPTASASSVQNAQKIKRTHRSVVNQNSNWLTWFIVFAQHWRTGESSRIAPIKNPNLCQSKAHHLDYSNATVLPD